MSTDQTKALWNVNLLYHSRPSGLQPSIQQSMGGEWPSTAQGNSAEYLRVMLTDASAKPESRHDHVRLGARTSFPAWPLVIPRDRSDNSIQQHPRFSLHHTSQVAIERTSRCLLEQDTGYTSSTSSRFDPSQPSDPESRILWLQA